jgi:hypothetical protein
MQPGTKVEALELAKVRWSEIWPFDIDADAWRILFEQHRPNDILQAIRRTKSTTATAPDKVFRSLQYCIKRLEEDRAEKANPIWPPSDVQQN